MVSDCEGKRGGRIAKKDTHTPTIPPKPRLTSAEIWLRLSSEDAMEEFFGRISSMVGYY